MFPNAETIYRQFRLLLPFTAYSDLPDADVWPMKACVIRADGVWCVYNSYAGYSFRLWMSERYCCLFGLTNSESITDERQYVKNQSVPSKVWRKVKRTLQLHALPSDDDLNFLLESRGPREEWRLAKPFTPPAVKFALEAINSGVCEMRFTPPPDLAELIRAAKTITGSKRVEEIARLIHLGLPLGEAEVRSLMGRYWDLKRAKRLASENGIHVVWNDSVSK